MTLVGGLTPENLAARDELCREEAAHMAALKPTNPKKRESSLETSSSSARNKRRKVEPVRQGTPVLPSFDQTIARSTPAPESATHQSTSALTLEDSVELEIEEEEPEVIRCVCEHQMEFGFMCACDKCRKCFNAHLPLCRSFFS